MRTLGYIRRSYFRSVDDGTVLEAYAVEVAGEEVWRWGCEGREIGAWLVLG